MTGDPTVHNNPEGWFWTTTESVAEMVGLVPSIDEIGRGDDIVRKGEWSESVLPVLSFLCLSATRQVRLF